MPMASNCMAMSDTRPAASACKEKHTKQQMPTKQCHCMGTCSATEIAKANFASRMKLPLAAIPIPVALSLGDAPLERETPPPRLS